MGGCFVTLNKQITLFRKKFHAGLKEKGYKVSRLVEAVITMAIISSIFYWISFAFDCTDYTTIDTLAHAHLDAEHGLYPIQVNTATVGLTYFQTHANN